MPKGNDKQDTNKKRRIWTSVLLLAALLALVAVMVADLIPLVRQVVENRSDESKVVHYIEAYGAKGVPVLIGLQVLQVLVSIFPATPIQMLAGLCYGIWVGTFICIVGCVLGNALLFLLMRQFGRILSPILGRKPRKPKKPKHPGLNLSRISQSKHPERAAFVLAVTAASVPSSLLFTWLGERISKGDYKTAIILAVVLVLAVSCILLFRNKIITAINKKEEPASGTASK